MKSKEALRVLADVTAAQWGMVTSAQAGAHGVTRLALSRLAESGHLTRLAQGVYKDSGSPSDQFEDLRAAWLSTEPKAMGEDRLRDRVSGVVVAGSSAARLHGIGDLWANRHEFTSPQRRQSQRAEIRYRLRVLDPQDVTMAEGLPTMTAERTIADLIDDLGDLSLVADALRDAALKGNLHLGRLRELLAPLAERHGFGRHDGEALLRRLLEIAGIDADAIAQRVAADSSLGSLVVERYLSELAKADLDRLVMTPEMRKSVQVIRESVAEAAQRALAPHAAMLNAGASMAIDAARRDAAVGGIAQAVAAQITNGDSFKRLVEQWGKSRSISRVPKPETLAAIEAAQRTGRGGERR